jgi:hypothetical protein
MGNFFKEETLAVSHGVGERQLAPEDARRRDELALGVLAISTAAVQKSAVGRLTRGELAEDETNSQAVKAAKALGQVKATFYR